MIPRQGTNELALVLVGIPIIFLLLVLLGAAGYGYVTNISLLIELAKAYNESHAMMGLLRLAGVLIPPLGAILGYF
jgi:hypothetical protein